MNPTGMMKVYEKKYVHEKERNEILAQRCNNQHEEIMMLKNKMEKLKRQADTNMKYNQDRDEDEEENLYYENAENPEVVEDTRSKKAGRSSSSSNSKNKERNTDWKNAYEKMEETCRLLKNKLGYPDDFVYSDVVLEEGMKSEMRRLKLALQRAAVDRKKAVQEEKNKVIVLQRRYAQEKRKAETYHKAAKKADVDGDVLRIQKQNEGYRATTVRQGLRIQKLEKILKQTKKKLEALNEEKNNNSRYNNNKNDNNSRDEGKKNEEVDVNDNTNTATFHKSKSNKDKDAEDLIHSLKRRVRKLQKRNMKLSDSLTMQKVLAEAAANYGPRSKKNKNDRALRASLDSSLDANKSAKAAADLYAKREARLKLRCKAQEDELKVLRTKVTELVASNYNLMGRAATTTQILASRDGVADNDNSNNKNGMGFGRPIESLEEEVNVLRQNNVDMELELKRVNAALRTEQNMSQQRLQELSDIKYQIENNIKNEKKVNDDNEEEDDDDLDMYDKIGKAAKDATNSIDTRKRVMEQIRLQRRIERLYSVLREKQMEIHQLKTNSSKSAPMAQATERALEEYFNEVVRLRDIIANLKGSFQKSTNKLRKRAKREIRKSKKVKNEMEGTLNRILEVYPEAVAIVTAGSNSNSWLSGQIRTIKPVLSRSSKKDVAEGKENDKSPEEDILEWTTTDVVAWLATTVEMTKYVENFSDESIDGHLLLTLTNDDLKDDLDIDDSNDRDTIMREILKLRESSRSYKKFYGAGNVGDVNKVPKAKTPFTENISAADEKATKKNRSQKRDIWSPLNETAISPRDEEFDRKIRKSNDMEERIHLMKRELSRLRSAKRNALSREQQLKMQFEREKDMILREQEEMLNAMQYEQQMMAQQFMQQQQQGYNMGGGMMMSQQEEDEAWKKEQRRQEIEALKASLGHVDEKGKALPEALRPKVQKLPSQMNDAVAPPMEHHSPDLKKQPKRSAMKKGPRSSKKEKPRVKYAGKKEFNVAIIPRIDDDQIDELFWSQEDQANATEEVDREETMKEFMELKRLREQGIDVPSVNPFRVGANIMSSNNNNNDTWGDMSGIQFAEDDPYYYDDDQNNLTTTNTMDGGLSKSKGFINLPQQQNLDQDKQDDDEEVVEDDGEYGDANFEISGSDEDGELSEDADF